MSLKCLASCMAGLLLVLGGAAMAQTKAYPLAGGGGQLAIGRGLPMPAQVFPTSATGAFFPPLLIPANTAKFIQGTTAMSVQQKLSLPRSVLFEAPAQRTVGMFAQNLVLYAVASNLGWAWPSQPAVLSRQARTGAKTTSFTSLGGWIRYSNASASKFGGPARFAITHGSGGRIANAPVTIYLIYMQPTGNPPCTHTALTPTTFPGTYATSACVAALGGIWPLTQGVIGGPVGVSASAAALGNPVPGIGIGKFGASPPGTVSFFTFTPNGTMSGFTDKARSVGYPWTTGMLTISYPRGCCLGDLFTITGMDSRTAGGVGTIQLVAGGLSTRAASGPNANRGWIRLQLGPPADAVPTLSPAGLAAAAALMLLAVAYALRRRFSAPRRVYEALGVDDDIESERRRRWHGTKPSPAGRRSPAERTDRTGYPISSS